MAYGSWAHVIVVVCSLLAMAADAKPAATLTTHRILQLEREGVASTGPQATVAKGTVEVINTALPYTAGAATSKLVILTKETVAPLDPLEAAPKQTSSTFANVVAVLSDAPKGVIFSENVLEESNVQSYLISQAFAFPMVLAPNSQNLSLLVNDIVPSVATDHTMGLLFAVIGNNKLDSPSKVEIPEIQVIQASVTPSTFTKPSKKSPKSTSTAHRFTGPSVLLSAAVDGLGITPSHEYVDVSAAAVAAEVHKTMSFYNGTGAGEFALHSIFASHSRWNYVGTRRWMSQYMEAHPGQALGELFDFTLSLDTVMPPPRPGSCGAAPVVLYVHSAVPIELDGKADKGLGKFCSILQAVAKAKDIEVQFVPKKKINVSHYDLRFEHEVFAHKKIPAITLSTHSEPQSAEQVLRHTYCRRLPNSPLTDHGAFSAASLVHSALSHYFGIAEAGSHGNKLSLVSVQGLVHAGVHRDGGVDSLTSPSSGFRGILEKFLKRSSSANVVSHSHVVVQKFPSNGLPVSVVGPLVQVVEFHFGKSTAAEVLITAAVGMFVVAFAVVMFGFEKAMLMFAAPETGKKR